MKKKEKLRRKLLIFLLTLVMVVGLMPGMSMTARADGPYGGGDGTENNPYVIETLEHLQQLKESVNNGTNYEGTFFILKNSISISDSEWTPIGTATCTTSGNSWSISAEKPFQGTFDGDNNEISGLSITGDKNVQGLFGYVGNNGKVKNLIVSGSVKGNVLIGGIVGYNKGTVSGCHNKVAVGAKGLFHDTGNNAGGGGVVGTNVGTVKGCTNSGLITGITAHATKEGCYKDGTNIGGVVGGNSGTVTECWNTGTVNAAGNTGGVLGANYGTLSKSYNAGDVAGTSWSVAGLLGINRRGGVVENCYNTGTLNSTGVGNSGIVGTQQSSKDIKNCYNYGTVKLGDGENYGQIIGGSSGKTPSYCYYPSNLASVNLNTNGGSPLSDEQFAKKESFSGWDFSDVWYLDNGVRPLLKAIPETIPNKPGFEYDTENKKLKITVDSEDTTIYYTKDGKRPEVTSETIQNGGTIDDLEGGETINVILMKENAVLMSTSYVCPYTVTYKVVNGTWSDDSTADRTEAVVSGLKPASVPTGMKASEGFAGGEWDEDPSNTTITEGKIFTYTFTAKATVTQAPTSKDPTYTGEPQGIIYPGTANGGTMQYAIGTNNSEPPTSGWSESIPTATEAGTYYVWYKVKADNNHNDTDANYVEVSIGKRSVTLTSATASKVYDGTALTNTDVTVGGDGFVTGEGVTCNVTGSQILPGNTKNTFTYTLNSGTTAGNYEITKTEGTLTVTDRTDEEGDDKKYEITVTANSNDFTYDGTEHSVSGFVQTAFTFNGVTYTVSGLTATAKGTDVGSYTAEVTGTAVVKDANDNNLTNQFIVSTSNGILTINKRNVTLTSATASKTYDGNALTDNTVTTSGDGFATGEGATYSVTGSQKVVGSSANAFTYTLNTGTKEANYNITKTEGTLKVTSRDAKYQISPQANSDEVKYDGQSHEVTGFETDTFTVEGNTYTVSGLTAAGSGTDAGSYTVSVSGTAVVKDSDGNDVSDEFAVTPQTGTLTINKRSVTLTSASDEKEYDGDALTNDEVTVTGDGFVTGEGATYDVTGTRTLVGSSENAFTYTLNEGTKADNYDITPSYGTLTVNNRNTKYEVTLTANSGTEKYDGNEKTVSGYTIDGNAGEGTGESVVTSFTASNGKTYTVTGMSAEVTGTNAGEYAVNVIGTPIVKDADGNDVTAQFAVSGESGKLTIDKRSVTLTSATDTKVYDGKALSNDEITVSEDGFAEGEGATYDVTGSQTLAGESANAFTYALSDGTIADNYDITTVEGKLTVTKSDSSGEVTAVSGLIYDGKAKALVTARKTEGGSLMYRLGTDGKWQQDIPEATDAGTYKIYYYIKGDDNHKDDGSEKEPKGSVETTIKKAAQDKPAEIFAVAEASDDKTADGKISGFDKTKTYQYSADDGKTWTDVKAGSTEIAVKSGTYQIRYAEDKNHEAGKTASVTVTGKNDVPGTGDTVNIQLIILVMILSMCGIFALCNLRSILEEKKRRK